MLSFASTAVIDGNVILRRENYFLSDRYEMQRLGGEWSFPHVFSGLLWVEEGKLSLVEERSRICETPKRPRSEETSLPK